MLEYVLYILIILVIITLFIISDNKIKLLQNIGITSIVSSGLLLVIGFVLKLLIDAFLNNFNITKISSLILNKFLYTSVFSLIIGIISIIISKLIIISRKTTNVS